MENKIAEQFIKDCMTFLGVKYHHQGRTRAGVDCVGFLVAACRMQDLPIIDSNNYGMEPVGLRLLKHFEDQPFLYRVPIEERRRGDTLVFRIWNLPQHCALYLGRDEEGNELIIHSADSIKEVQLLNISEVWTKRIVAVFRFRESEGE
jgi:cell wall-associated NlpC family hydrolase